MKHVIILGDGMADWHHESLGGKTLLQHAHTPNMDRLARMGQCGLLRTVADGFHPGSEVANSSILGYDQHVVYEGRGPLEAASIGVELADDDLALRCNLVSLDGNLLRNHSCGRLETEDADILIKYLQDELGSERVHFYTGVQYRHLLVIKGGNKHLRCTPPHDIPLKPWREYMLSAETPEAEETARLLTELVYKSQVLLKYHPLNAQRQEQGLDPVSSIWPWGGGYRPRMAPLTHTFASQIHTGVVITAVDLIRGIGHYAGLHTIDVPGATGLWDTNYAGKAHAAIQALRTNDFVYLHVEAADEAGHDGDLALKIQCIENIDKYIVGPIMQAVEEYDEHVAIALLPDHPTPIDLRTHTAEPIPFAMWYPGIEADAVETFDEDAAAHGMHGLLQGDQFIHRFMSLDFTHSVNPEIF
ncbi:MAG: cofactor-independent phosphoglycerate mutase [Bacteroidaceae bacterium]|nr:cofactor-independent phosphoglycerate mutase [Bacteroidaceae bacterium]